MSMIDRYRRWYAYECDAHERVIESLEGVPEGRREEPAFRRAVDLLDHVIAARWMWLHRMGVDDDGPTDLFSHGATLDEVVARVEPVQAMWTDHLASLDDAAIEQDFEYRSTEGERYRSRIEDIFTQLFGHSWYHRGQIASAVKACGGEPAVTDLVYWSREPLEG